MATKRTASKRSRGRVSSTPEKEAVKSELVPSPIRTFKPDELIKLGLLNAKCDKVELDALITVGEGDDDKGVEYRQIIFWHEDMLWSVAYERHPTKEIPPWAPGHDVPATRQQARMRGRDDISYTMLDPAA